MSKFALLLLAASALTGQVAPAHAQVVARTFVSATTGVDTNDCSFSAPCRTFQRAHDATAANGEIVALGTGGYGQVTIKKAISIVNEEGEASVLVSVGAGITVAAGDSDAVTLRGLTIKGTGTTTNGVVFVSGKSLSVENCVVRDMGGTGTSGTGILFQPNGTSHLAVMQSLIVNNAFHGVLIQPTGAGNVTANLDRAAIYNSGFRGLEVIAGNGGSTATVNAVATDSLAVKNNAAGYTVVSAGPQATLMLVRSLAADSGNEGISAVNANASLRIGQSTLTGNARTWFTVGGGLLQSFGDNYIVGNLDGDPVLPGTIARR
jgi:hypothetical protein